MRRSSTAALAAVALTVGLAAPAAAHPRGEVLPPLTVDLTHAASTNVGFVARLPEHAGSAGGALTSNDAVEDLYVLTDPRGLFTYDVSDPRSPQLLGQVLINQGGSGTGAALAQEDPPTDGRVVLVDGLSEAGSGMHIVSIEDPSNPTVLGVHSGTDHTWTCVTDIATDNGCAFAYGRTDNIIDIRDPQNPVKVESGWEAPTGESGYTHDLTEIRPGLVMTAGAQPVLMDTTDPANPVKISHITLRDHGPEFGSQREWTAYGYHSVEWANEGTDGLLVMGTEVASADATVFAAGVAVGDDCDGADQAVIETWDATPVLEAFERMDALKADGISHADARTAVFGDGDTVKFERIDAYAASGPGAFIDGKAVGNVLYCAHWMEVDPNWDNGGQLVVGYYNRGVRFVDVAADGTMEEAGWFTGADAYTGSAQWVDDTIVYVSDYARGLDIVEINPEAEMTGYYTADSALADRALTMARIDEFGIAPPVEDGVPYGALSLAGLALAAAALLRRRVTA